MLHSELTNLVSVFRGYFVLNLLLKDLPDIFKEQYNTSNNLLFLLFYI